MRNSGLFDCSPIRGARGWVTVPLDPQQPYLSHHDVGTPLLGTVVSLEIMVEALFALWGEIPTRICGIRAGEDCLVPAKKQVSCTVNPLGSCRCAALFDGAAPIFSCQMEFDSPAPPPSQQAPPLPDDSVTGPQVYGCFFHGPAFQVVNRAWVADTSLLGQMTHPLPPLRTDSPHLPILPITEIEFCLQCSGLLDAALHQRMAVPISIGAVELYSPATWDGIWAVAKFNGSGCDIRAYNADGQPVLAVLNYQTKPMPYACPGFDPLCRALLHQ